MTPKARQSNPEQLPPCVYWKNGAYYLVKRGKWTRLGKDRRTALMAHARLTSPATSGPMADLIDEAMVEILGRVKKSSGKQYKVAAKQLKELLVEFEPQQVTTADVAAVKREYRGRPRAGNQALNVLRMVFVYACENGHCTSNPCIGLPIFKVGKRDRLIEWGEYHAIHAAAPPVLQVYIELLVATGQRPCDVVSIRRVDLRDGGIYFKQRKTGAKVLVKSAAVSDAVDHAKSLYAAASLTLFRTSGPALYELWRTACAAAGVLDAQLRDLRALAATEAERQGLDPQKLLGHTTAATTTRYLRGRETPVVEGPFIRQVLDTSKKTTGKQG
jgi:integrase